MMTALSPVPSKQTSNGPHQNGVMTNGKRKAPPTGAGKRDEQQGKRRRKSSNTPTNTAEETSHMNGIEEDKKPVPKSNHLRFGSEEPVLLEETPAEIPAAPNHDEEDEDSDDDAPEAIDNSAQLLKIKEQAKKQETAKQVEGQLKKEKRRKLDERRKLQAKSTAKNKDSSGPADDLSESATTQDTRPALPALLPDEILNAEPVARPPTPPAEDPAGPKKLNKLKFLDKTDKALKDVKVGDVAIRVLDAPSKKKKSHPTLPPKASKAARNAKENLLGRNRSMAKANGLRWTAGGPKRFIRR